MDIEGYAGCVGVDGARQQWLAVQLGRAGLSWSLHADPGLLLQAHAAARVIAVDIPIGLSEAGPRAADVLARRFVGGKRACSVFSAPVRGILQAPSQLSASRQQRQIDGRGFGVQSFALLSKIRGWDVLLQADPGARQRVYEVHPEVCFAALNGGPGRGILHAKRQLAGRDIRMELLGRLFGRAAVADLVRCVPRPAAADDVLDALAALWSAGRIAAGQAISLPSPPVQDATGLTAAIWY